MIKFIFIIIFIRLMYINRIRQIFYYNLIFLMGVIITRIFIYKDSRLWEIIRIGFALNYYSFCLVILRVWIIGLIFMRFDFYFKEIKRQIIVFLVLLIILILYFLSVDLIVFYLIFEIRIIPTFLLIIYWGRNPERLRAAYYLIIYILIISFPLLVLLFWIYVNIITFKFIVLEIELEKYILRWIYYLIIFFPFYIKIPMYIFHLWLPKAHVEAPVYGSIVLAGVLLKIGRYGLVRLIKILVKRRLIYRYQIFRIRIIGALVVRIVCLVQIDIKRLVAYSSVVHINIILCAFITIFKLGVWGRYIIIISHGLCSSGLFYIVNLFYRRTKSRLLILNKGLGNKLGGLMIWWFILCIANISFPFSLNFFREIYIIIVILNWDRYIYLFIIFVCFLRGAYSLYLYSYVQHGGPNRYHEYVFNFGFIKEFIVLILHIYPLIIILLNLLIFI